MAGYKKYSWLKKTLRFKFPAGTSRGTYTSHDVWYIFTHNADGAVMGIGEAAPLPGLSPEYSDSFSYEKTLSSLLEKGNKGEELQYADYADKSSICFGMETALKNSYRGSLRLFDNPFTSGMKPIQINGLIWMGSKDLMLQRIREKIDGGFRCLKLKVGAISFEDEIDLLNTIRTHFNPDDLSIRLDANGAFSPETALKKLSQLSAFNIDSIEQPLPKNSWEQMAKLCGSSPIPIALDEELTGHYLSTDKGRLLDIIKPQYIVLKPTLHGGFRGCREWIKLAKERGIGFWMTSALESNIGLNAIAQFCGSQEPEVPQGLGTGQIYEKNVPMPCLSLQGDELFFNPFEAMENLDYVKKTIESEI